jgi:hypothetical protein
MAEGKTRTETALWLLQWAARGYARLVEPVARATSLAEMVFARHRALLIPDLDGREVVGRVAGEAGSPRTVRHEQAGPTGDRAGVFG